MVGCDDIDDDDDANGDDHDDDDDDGDEFVGTSQVTTNATNLIPCKYN